jgi:hypothetical protein
MAPRKGQVSTAAVPTSPDPTQVGENRPLPPPPLNLAGDEAALAAEHTIDETRTLLPESSTDAISLRDGRRHLTLEEHVSDSEDDMEEEESVNHLEAILHVLKEVQLRLTALENRPTVPAPAPPPVAATLPIALPSVFPSTSAAVPPVGTTLGLAAAPAPLVPSQRPPAHAAARLAASPTTSEKAARIAAAKLAKAQKAKADQLGTRHTGVHDTQEQQAARRLAKEKADTQALLDKEQADMHAALEASMADQQVRATQRRPVTFLGSTPGPSGVNATTRTACHNSCCTAGPSSQLPSQTPRPSYSAILQQGRPALGMAPLPTHHVSDDYDPTQVETRVIDFMELAQILPAQGDLDKNVRINDLPIFKGEHGDAIQSFVQNMTNAFARMKIPVCQWMPLVQARMRDTAESWLLGQIQVKELAGGPHLSFREFVKLATSTFGRIQPVESWVAQWVTSQQTGTTAAFIARYQEFRRRIPQTLLSDALMAIRFRQTCRRDIAAEFIRIDSALPLQDVFLTASEIETRLGTAPQPPRQYNALVDGRGPSEIGPQSTVPEEDLSQSYQDYGSSLDPAIPAEQREEMVMAYIQRKRGFAGKRFPRTTSSARQTTSPSSFQYPPKMTPAIMEWCIREQRCFRCRQTGHSSQSCPHAHRFTEPRQARPSSGLNTLNTETPQIPVIQGTTMLPPSGPPLS